MKKCSMSLRRDGFPVFGALISVNAKVLPADRRIREFRDDESNMTTLRNHGICTIGRTLTRPTRVDMDIRDYDHALALADFPKGAEVAAIEADDASVQGVRVQVIVKDEILDSGIDFSTPAQKESPALPAPSFAPFTKPNQKFPPEEPTAGEFMMRREDAACSLEN